jgi:hypothetical protein
MGAVHAREAAPDLPTMEEEEIPLSSVRAKVVAVTVEGLARTRDATVMDSLHDLFKVRCCFSLPFFLGSLGGVIAGMCVH